jgi:8-oxo-dGTP pyrophosphatase MutT (NUDIX family)
MEGDAMLQARPEDSSIPGTAEIEDIAQAGAICVRRTMNGSLRVLLVGSKRNGRWGLPKGHIEANESYETAAGREAFEEAGALGAVLNEPFGTFTYFKDDIVRRYRVTTHLLEVRSVAERFPEKNSRKSQWFPLQDAIAEVSQPGLRALLARLG